ncbi:MAG: hypothetical protein Q7S09_01260 [bacterium]|nr:hypothetical protein [bacterium]
MSEKSIKERKTMNLANIKEMFQDEAVCWDRVENLRSIDLRAHLLKVRARDRAEAIERGIGIARYALQTLQNWGLDAQQFEPGHGIGHLMRDYLNALRLLGTLDADPRDIFVGIVGGVMHDVSCALVKRYEESKKAVRHAEAGALLFLEISEKAKLPINREETELIAYAIAAHTQYLREMDVACRDGITRRVRPYRDLDDDGKPVLAIWLPRWIDRLDCSGPTMVGRHFLTLAKNREDYNIKTGYYSVNFEDHLRPLLRTPEEIRADGGNQTMREHLHMFASTQTNASPYGKHDFGRMCELRNASREMLLEIISRVQEFPKRSSEEQENILNRWESFLGKTIEPSTLGRITAKEVCGLFRNLDESSRLAWSNGFQATMDHYASWSETALRDLAELPKEWLSLSMVEDNFVQSLTLEQAITS